LGLLCRRVAIRQARLAQLTLELAFANVTAMKKPKPLRAYLETDDAPGKRAILTAALGLFTSKGIDGTSVRDIAAATGLTNPALFRHFAGKEALALYLFERIFCRLRATLPVVDSSPFSGQLRATLASYLRFIDEDLDAALFFQETLRQFWPHLPATIRRQSLMAHLRRLLAVGVAQNHIDARESQQLLLAAVLGLLGQLARQLYFKEFPGPAIDQLDAVHRLVLRSLGDRPGARTST
jgi:AcrR family transcriptional regulator